MSTMGVPKQKWSVEEENALKAGVVKHGAGKWRTILIDSEFHPILYLRSNVDLKDKWRNMSEMANGYGSRDEGDDDPMAPATAENAGNHVVDVKPPAIIPGISHITESYKSTSRQQPFYRAPTFFSPRTTPTPMMCPTTPQANVSARVNPAGSPVCKPDSLTSNFNPAVAFLFAEGARPNLPANSIKLVDVTIIRLVGEPR